MSTEPTAQLCGAVLVKANRLVGGYAELDDASSTRAAMMRFNDTMLSMASDDAEIHAIDAFHAVALLRRAVSLRLKDSEQPKLRYECLLTFGAFDLLSTTAGVPITDASRIRDVCIEGAKALRAVCEAPEAWLAEMTSAETKTLVARSLCTQVLASCFDAARFTHGGRASSLAFTDDLAPLTEEHLRAELGRADAYAVLRLYAALQLVVAILMAGAAGVAKQDAEEVQKLRVDIGDILTTYDSTKRKAATERKRPYVAQTAGCVAALQEVCALLTTRASRSAALFDALRRGLGRVDLFEMSSHCSERQFTFWGLVGQTQETRHAHCEDAASPRVVSIEHGIVCLTSMLVANTMDDKYVTLVCLSSSMREATRSASQTWPPPSNFFGSGYFDTDRKIAAKAVRAGRDPESREIGEAFGFRLEWISYLSNPDAPMPRRHPGGAAERLAAAVTSLGRVETLQLKNTAASSTMPQSTGNGIHHVHGLALRSEPGHAHFPLVEDDNGVYDNDAYDSARRKQLFLDKVIEKVICRFKSWTGGALATELFAPFFLQVWRKFNANMTAFGSPWSEKLEAWLEHYNDGTTPGRSDGKLIHPNKLMYLQKTIAQSLLHELYGEASLIAMPAERRARLRLERALLTSLIAVYDFSPWASHVIRAFCAVNTNHILKKRKCVAVDEPEPAPTRRDSPSLAWPPPSH